MPLNPQETIEETAPNLEKGSPTKINYEISPRLEGIKIQKSTSVAEPKDESKSNSKRNLNQVNLALKENFNDKKIVTITNSAKVPSFNVNKKASIGNSSSAAANAATNISNAGSSSAYSGAEKMNKRVLVEEVKDKIEISNSFIVKTNIPSNSNLNSLTLRFST